MQRMLPASSPTARLHLAAIGNGRVLALVSPTSAMEWLYLPRFDSPSIWEIVDFAPAAALEQALDMQPQSQRARMRLMRGLVQEFNVFRWAGRMLIDSATMRRRGRLLERATGPAEAAASAGGARSS